jgi:hypothetical protein
MLAKKPSPGHPQNSTIDSGIQSGINENTLPIILSRNVIFIILFSILPSLKYGSLLGAAVPI